MNILVIGAGSIGTKVIQESENIDKIDTCYVYDHHEKEARQTTDTVDGAEFTGNFDDIIDDVDLVVEAASQEAVKEFGKIVLESGKDLMIMSVGALADDKLREELFNTAEEEASNIYLPTGALCGLDGIESASIVDVDEVTLETKKSPNSLRESKFVKENDIDVDSYEEKEVLFEGKAKEAVKHFPKNVNVAAALSLAGIGFERTTVKIILDPHTDRNSHTIKLKGEAGDLMGRSLNLPFPDNPRTSYLAALSAVSALKKICGNVWSGM